MGKPASARKLLFYMIVYIANISCYMNIILKVRRTIAEIMDLCYSFGELVQGIGKERFLLSAEREETLGHISKVCK